MKKILKKILIKLNRVCGFEIIDQNEFSFPSLKNKTFNDLSSLNQKSIVVPLGEVKITRKIKSLGIIVRTNSNIHISDQNKKRIFNEDKLDYILKSLKSLVITINSFNKKYPNFRHHDLHADNILINNNFKHSGYRNFKIGNKVLKVNNIGIESVINDFEFSVMKNVENELVDSNDYKYS